MGKRSNLKQDPCGFDITMVLRMDITFYMHATNLKQTASWFSRNHDMFKILPILRFIQVAIRRPFFMDPILRSLFYAKKST